MTNHHVFAVSSGLWLAIFFSLGTYIGGIHAGFLVAAVTYVVPFGGLFCSAILAYYSD
jgi:hypothetical protein